ncbi:hypothetical protein MMC25_000040 [Agyrium rufum]|nr:hypothetical protein [Agyrium rufum]
MTAVDNQQRTHLGSLGYENMPYSGAHFNNPWPQSANSHTSSSSHLYSNLPSQSSIGGYPSQPKSPSAIRSTTMSLPYSSAPASAPPIGSGNFPSSGYSHDYSSGDYSSQPRSYESSYPTSSSQPMASYTSSSPAYAPINSYGHSLAHQQQQQSQDSSRRLSPPHSSTAISHPSNSYGDVLDAGRGMLAMSQDLTPRNIYGPREDRNTTDSYGFPSSHSAHSSISNASSFPSSYYAGSVDGSSSVSDYSSEAASMDSYNSRTLPRPSGLAMPPAPQSMMGQFNSKVSSSAQKKHKCKICSKRFTRPSSLQTHMYSHTGEKPFACEVDGCGRNFSVVSNLRRHRKVHKDDNASSDDHNSPEGSWVTSSEH